MLKKWAERYPNNWRLVADAMNSSRIRSKSDLRTPVDCLERWKVRWSGLHHRGSIASASGSIASLDDFESVDARVGFQSDDYAGCQTDGGEREH